MKLRIVIAANNLYGPWIWRRPLFSLSRAAWLNLLIAVICYLFLLGKIKWYMLWRIGLVGVASVCLVVLGAVLNPTIIFALAERNPVMSYDYDRFSIQQAIASEILVHPIAIGHGQTELRFNYASHNLYLRVLIENAWLGGIVFVSLLLVCVVGALKKVLIAEERNERSNYAMLVASLIAALVNSLFIDSPRWRHLLLLLGMAIGVRAIDYRPNLTKWAESQKWT